MSVAQLLRLVSPLSVIYNCCHFLFIENPDAEKSETKSVPADAADAAAS
jgi:hypothetical protein